MNLKDCVTNGYLIPELKDDALILKEIQESNHDYNRAQKLFNDGDYKWTIITCYYSMC